MKRSPDSYFIVNCAAPKTPSPETSKGPPAEVLTTTVNIVETASQALSVAMESVSLGNPIADFPEIAKKVLAGLEVVSKTSGFSFLKGTSEFIEAETDSLLLKLVVVCFSRGIIHQVHRQ
jgi:hypothetical protein